MALIAVSLVRNRQAPDLDNDAALGLVVDAAQGAADVDEIASRLQIGPATAD